MVTSATPLTAVRAALAGALCALLWTSSALAAPAASNAETPKAYRMDAAHHIYASFPEHIYKGKLPPLVHAIVVMEVDVGADGQVRDIHMIRTPSHAPEVTAAVKQMIQSVSPLPAPMRMAGGTKYMDVWLVDKSGRFQLDTLTEGQR